MEEAAETTEDNELRGALAALEAGHQQELAAAQAREAAAWTMARECYDALHELCGALQAPDAGWFVAPPPWKQELKRARAILRQSGTFPATPDGTENNP